MIALWILGGIALFVLGSFAVKTLWNWLVPTLFKGPIIQLKHAAGILLVSRLLFGGFAGPREFAGTVLQRDQLNRHHHACSAVDSTNTRANNSTSHSEGE